jgi:hypothetical protein
MPKKKKKQPKPDVSPNAWVSRRYLGPNLPDILTQLDIYEADARKREAKYANNLRPKETGASIELHCAKSCITNAWEAHKKIKGGDLEAAIWYAMQAARFHTNMLLAPSVGFEFKHMMATQRARFKKMGQSPEREGKKKTLGEQVIDLEGKGKQQKEIGKILGRHPRTLRRYKSAAQKKDK